MQRGVHAAQRLQTETKQGLMLRRCENRVKGAREVGGGEATDQREVRLRRQEQEGDSGARVDCVICEKRAAAKHPRKLG